MALFHTFYQTFLSDRRQRIAIDGYHKSFTNAKYGVPQGTVIGHLFIFCTSGMWQGFSSHTEAYADNYSLFCPIPNPHNRSFVVTQLNDDLDQILSCQRWGMKLNPGMTKSIVFSQSSVANPPLPNTSIGNQVKKSPAVL